MYAVCGAWHGIFQLESPAININKSEFVCQQLPLVSMAPIRRYLRITKHSVLECRIFLENPADGPRWLLNPRDPALPRVFEAIRPLVLPKLREENERAKGKGKKKKAVKDVVKQGGLNSQELDDSDLF